MIDTPIRIDPTSTGQEMYQLMVELFPICRSITGKGFTDTLDVLMRHIPLEIHRVPSGTRVFDWSVPREWNITDAYVKNEQGEKIIDFQQSNLHIVNYSIPIHSKLSLNDLKDHLFSLPEHPDWIPYKTSYYKENWGFCLSHNKLQELKDGEYEVYIDSTLEQGYLTYGECFIPGETEEEVLISCHACHPSLCNDNLSGVALTTYLAKFLHTLSLHHSYRFLFIPGTIGAITWLALNEDHVSKIQHGLVVACVGDSGHPHYKKSRRGNAEIDRIVSHVLNHSGQEFELEEFSPYGYDERQYCSPGFDLPVGSLSRTPHGRYAEYHTSADNLSLVKPASLANSLQLYLETIFILENNQKYINTNPKCEPQLGKRGLYSTLGGQKDNNPNEISLLWVLNFSDGQHDLLDIAEKSGMKFRDIYMAAKALLDHGLLLVT
jgi:aminopeptidase-like protein